jgi:hypothetical protein
VHPSNELSLYAEWLGLVVNFREHLKGVLRRITLPRTPLNKDGAHLPTLAITIHLPANSIRPSSSSANVSAVKYLLKIS